MTQPVPDEHPNQFALLKQCRFAPFFWTQFSGAANDNLFKFAFTVMVTYQFSVSWLPPALAVWWPNLFRWPQPLTQT